MAGRLVETLACQPSTERGKGVLIDGHVPSRTLAYCNGKCVILRRLDSPRDSFLYVDHSYPVHVARLSPNGEWVASGDASGVVRVWARGGDHVLRNEVRALSGPVLDLRWSEDGQRLAACGEGKQQYVRAFMWDGGGNMGDFEGHSKRVLSCDFRPKRPFRVFSGGEDFCVNYYEGPPFRFKLCHRDHSNFVNCIRFSPDGARVITVSSDRKGFIFDAQTGSKIGSLSSEGGHKGSIYAAAWSPDSKQVVTVSADKTAKVWSIADDGSSAEVLATFGFSAQGVERLEGPNATSSGSVDFMQVGCLWMGDTIVTVSLNGDFNLIPSASVAEQGAGLEVGSIQGHQKHITALALTEEGGELYSASYDAKVIRWSEATGLGTETKGQCHTSVVAMDCVEGKLVTIGLDDTLRLTPLPATDFGSSPAPVPLHAQPRSLSIAKGDTGGEGPLMLITTVKGVSLFQGPNLLVSHTLPFEPSAAALSPDGKLAAIGSSADGQLLLFRVQGSAAGFAFQQTGALERHRGPITAIKFSPDGSLLASGDQNREAVVWDVNTLEPKLKNLVYHTARISCLGWSPDSTKVATGSLDMSIVVYAVEQPATQRVTIKGAHTGGVSALLFRDANKIVSAGFDSCLRVWELV